MRSYITQDLKRQNLRMGFNFLAPFILLLILSCGGMKQSGSEENLKDFQKLSELVNSREFEIENEWLMPLGGSMINLIGNPNYIRFKADSVDVFLPYFGVRQSGGGYGGNGGITYTGPVKDLEISEGAANKNIQLNFSGKHNSENLEFFITLYQGGSVTTLVSSSQRQSISYRGNVKPLPEEGQ